MDVSVLIPAHQAAHTIARAIESVARQTLKPREIIIVDDGSTDHTAHIAESCRAKLGDVLMTIVTQPNSGPGSARNRALSIARSDWVAFLDADDEWLADKLEKTQAAISGCNYDPVLIGHDVIVVNQGREIMTNCAVHDVGNHDPFHAMYRRGYISTSTALARRKIAIEIGGFDTSLPNAQDFDMWLAILSKAESRVLVFPGAFVRHHNQPHSIQTHTWRRLGCCSRIAIRYLSDIRARPGSALYSFLFRIIAIHLEAMVAFYRARQWINLVLLIFSTPIRITGTILRAISFKSITRLNNIPST